MDTTRLTAIDDELARFDVDERRLREVLEGARRVWRGSLREADEILSALALGSTERFGLDAALRASNDVENDASNGAPRMLRSDGRSTSGSSADERLASDVAEPTASDEGRLSIEIFVEPALVAAAGVVADRQMNDLDAPSSGSALELELDADAGETPTGSIEAAAPSLTAPLDSSSSASASVDSPPSPVGDLDAELASILADELVGEQAPLTADEFETEPTTLFSADMFGVADEPNLTELLSRPPPEGAVEPDSVDLEIDDTVLLDDELRATRAEGTTGPKSAVPPPPPPSAPPSKPSSSLPASANPSAPPGSRGFLGRLLNRKG